MQSEMEAEGNEAGGTRGIAELRVRIDGFTPARQRKFLKWLGKTGCVRDAAGKAGISTTTIDRARRKFADFDARCVAALDLALPGLEAIAYRRATVGAAEKVIRKGRLVEVRVKPSDAMLRLLMTGAAPAKYGRHAGLKQKGRDDGRQRRDKWRKPPPSAEQVIENIVARVEAIRQHKVKHGGYTRSPEGALVPPGWRMVREEELARLGWTPPEGERPLPALPAPGESGEA